MSLERRACSAPDQSNSSGASTLLVRGRSDSSLSTCLSLCLQTRTVDSRYVLVRGMFRTSWAIKRPHPSKLSPDQVVLLCWARISGKTNLITSAAGVSIPSDDGSRQVPHSNAIWMAKGVVSHWQSVTRGSWQTSCGGANLKAVVASSTALHHWANQLYEECASSWKVLFVD